MKDYARMSDVDVARMVSAYLWGSVCSLDGVVLHPETIDPFDPCNNPADGWPIIVENGITLAFQDGNWWADNLAYWVDGVEWNIGGIIDKNPLRAAMVVFLMMKESEK